MLISRTNNIILNYGLVNILSNVYIYIKKVTIIWCSHQTHDKMMNVESILCERVIVIG